MSISSGNELLANELRQIYSAEKLLSRALPRLAKQVSSETLGERLTNRLEDGQTILEAVEAGLEELEVSVGRRKNAAAEGLIEDATNLVDEIEEDAVFDAALIGAVQKVQHYCLAGWGTTAAYARAMGQDELVEAMEEALDNGRAYDEELTRIAEEEVNPLAFQSAEQESSSDDRDEGRGSESRNRSDQRRRAEGGSENTPARGNKSSSEGGRERSSSNNRSSDNGKSLKKREYRDGKGEVHHHTRSYMERHRGSGRRES